MVTVEHLQSVCTYLCVYVELLYVIIIVHWNAYSSY